MALPESARLSMSSDGNFALMLSSSFRLRPGGTADRSTISAMWLRIWERCCTSAELCMTTPPKRCRLPGKRCRFSAEGPLSLILGFCLVSVGLGFVVCGSSGARSGIRTAIRGDGNSSCRLRQRIVRLRSLRSGYDSLTKYHRSKERRVKCVSGSMAQFGRHLECSSAGNAV